jgi:peptide/nickel transport system substrate-binding protein
VRLTRSHLFCAVALVMLSLLAALAAGCGGGGDEEESTPSGTGTAATPGATGDAATPKYGGVFRSIYYKDPLSLDPHINAEMPVTMQFTQAVYSQLLRYNPEMKIEPDLAESWEQVSPTEYVFHLRKGVKWQNVDPVNGREFVASDVKYSVDRINTPEARFTYKENLEGTLDKVEVVDDYTVRFLLLKPNVFFIDYIAFPALQMMPKEAVDKFGDNGELKSQAIGTGPFILESFSRGSGAKFKKNPDYFGKDKDGNPLPYLDGYEVSIITDQTARQVAFKTKQSDIGGVTTEEVDSFKKEYPTVVVNEFLVSNPFMVIQNGNRKPISDKRVRHAIMAATDRQQYLDMVFDGHGQVQYGMVPVAFGDWSLPRPADAGPDIARAKSLLAEAGYSNGFSMSCTVTQAVTQTVDLGQIFQEQMKEIGVDIKLDVKEWGGYLMALLSGNMDSMILPNQAFPTIDGYLYRSVHTGAAGNVFKFSYPELDAIVEKIRVTEDEGERKKLAIEAQEFIYDDAQAINFFCATGYSAYWPYVKNWDPTMFARAYPWYQLAEVWFDK